MSMGSAMEVEYRVLLARDVGLIPAAKYRVVEAELHALQRMLARFISRLRELDRFSRGKRTRTS
jgi:four helix bundle protein